ncbi:early endosome antigen 1-like [Salvia splendens]|uniref:early endosome antigen 1-like n=1 Tax=Salvia splendens TaxID=180675 RepID=UPI001C262070|nr:early endosome antigen 1-like [Salvia splendens]
MELQQFRQKKDNKGNNSKPSGKGGKSGSDKTAGTVSEAAGELSNHDTGDTVDVSESSSGVVAEASDTATESIPRVETVASDAASRVDPVTSESPVSNKDTSAKGKVGIACLLDVAGFPSEGSKTDNTSDGHDVDIRASPEDGSSSLVLEDTTINVPAMVLEERLGDSNLLLPTDFSSGLEREHGEEQVTDVGAMQEVGGSGGNETDDRMVIFLNGDSNPPTDDASDSIAERTADSGNRFAEENFSVATQLSKIDDASLTDSVANYAGENEEPRDHSFGTSPLTESSMMSTSVAMGHERDVTSFGPNDEKPEAVNLLDTEGSQANSGFFEVERSYKVKSNEILQVLDQDEFRYIFMSRESSAEKPRNADKSQATDGVIHDSFERLKEHLYMTSLSKDACYLQLSEHLKGIDGIAVNSSLVEVEGKNDTIAKEIVQCRNELQEALSEKVELEKQLQLSRSEADVFAAKVNELQNKLEMTPGEISGILSELVECRNLVQALQSENENLNVSFKVMIEEKNKLSQESRNVLLENEKITEELYQHRVSLESFQTLIQDYRKRLEQENYGLISENSKLLAGLAECQNTVEVLRVENKNLNEILTSLSEERKKFDEEKVSMDHQIGKMSEESVNCKELILTLQTEIINLNEHMRSLSEEKSKLEEEHNTIFSEYEKQYHKLVEFNVLETVLLAECCKAVKNLKEARTSIKHYTEENISLNADLEFHRIKLKDIDCQKNSSQFDEVESQDVKNDTGVLHESKSHQSSSRQMKLDIYSDTFGFLALKRNLEEAGVLMQKLEREIESMHLESSSLSRSTDAVSPGVSQLIQTFEPKGYTEKDGQDPEKSPSSEGHTTEDSHMRTKVVAQILKILLEELVSDAEEASEFYRVKQSRVLANAAGTDLSKYDALEEHNDQLQEANIELMVFYEAMRELIHHGVAKESELLGLCDAMQKQEAVLKLENHNLQEKMNDLQGHINELQVQLEGHCRDSDEMTSSISNQLQALQSEVSERELILQEEQSSVAAQILQTVAKLDSTANNISANPLPTGNSNPDIVGSVAASVDGACIVIQGLHGQLEAAQSEFQEMSHKTDVALSILHRLYSELVRTLFGCDPDAANEVMADGKRLDLLHPNIFDALLNQLKKLCSERLELQSANTQLGSQMTNTARETDELQKLYLKSDTVLKLIDEIEQSVKLERPAVCGDEPASLLESLIHLLIQKCRETGQGSSLCASLEMHVHDLQGEVERLNFVLMEYGNENLVFKHSLKSAQEVVIALNSKVQEKIAELELSEQRLSSLREKLGIAVTKGKGLISQRESLKQSLAETSKGTGEMFAGITI